MHSITRAHLHTHEQTDRQNHTHTHTHTYTHTHTHTHTPQARDPLPLNTYAVEFVVFGNQLGMLASDQQRNVQVDDVQNVFRMSNVDR